jgi:hypothetical protein
MTEQNRSIDYWNWLHHYVVKNDTKNHKEIEGKIRGYGILMIKISGVGGGQNALFSGEGGG